MTIFQGHGTPTATTRPEALEGDLYLDIDFNAISVNTAIPRSPNWIPLDSTPATSVRTYGAKGDGVTDDTLAIRAAITAAGTNGTLVFPFGSTYLVSGRLAPLQGQTWMLYGAVVKRANAISSATATAIATGNSSTTVTVSSAAGFSVGMDVGVFNGGTYDISSHAITAISGNQLTLATAFSTAFASGGTVFSGAFAVIDNNAAVSDFRVFGGEIDGNRANNAIFQHWELHVELRSYSDRGAYRDIYVHDAASEGIYVGGINPTVDHCYVLNCQGNGIHLSGTTHPSVTNCFVKNTNLSGTATGHADGCIIASDNVGDTYIAGNYCENGIAGIGSWDTDDDSSLVCIGNVIRNCTSYAFEGITPSGVIVGNICFENNEIYNSGVLNLSNTGSFAADAGPYRVSISNNLFVDTSVTIQQCFGVQFNNNTMQKVTNPTTGQVVFVTDSVGVLIHNNRIRGGNNGIYIDGSNGRDISINDNHLKDQNTCGIRFNNAGAGTGYSVRGNTVTAASTMNVGYNAIMPLNGVTVDGNSIDCQVAGTAGAILCPNGGVSVPGAFVLNNTIRSVAAQPSIKTFGGSQNNIILNNLVQQAVSNGGGASNTVTGTVTIF